MDRDPSVFCLGEGIGIYAAPSKSPIHILPVPHCKHKHQQDFPMNLINDAVVPNPHAPGIRHCHHLLAAGRKRIVAQGFDFDCQFFLNVAGMSFQLPKRQRLGLNGIGHNLTDPIA
jgi:hypothetical protein